MELDIPKGYKNTKNRVILFQLTENKVKFMLSQNAIPFENVG